MQRYNCSGGHPKQRRQWEKTVRMNYIEDNYLFNYLFIYQVYSFPEYHTLSKEAYEENTN